MRVTQGETASLITGRPRVECYEIGGGVKLEMLASRLQSPVDK